MVESKPCPTKERKKIALATTATENIVLVCLFVPRAESSVAGEVTVAGPEHDPAASRVTWPARALHLKGSSKPPLVKNA